MIIMLLLRRYGLCPARLTMQHRAPRGYKIWPCARENNASTTLLRDRIARNIVYSNRIDFNAMAGDNINSSAVPRKNMIRCFVITSHKLLTVFQNACELENLGYVHSRGRRPCEELHGPDS